MPIWTTTRIQRLRHARGETTATFGAHFARTSRAIEEWEQGRRRPDGLCVRVLDSLELERVQQWPRPSKKKK
jgi:DNA-binding transcriptional regulator YiaG